jgi:GDP-mannose 6-dehydrogenase
MQQAISVFGLGYVGCVSAACFAEAGHTVVGVDIDPVKVRMINAGASPIIEPGLDDLIGRMVREGRLRATLSCPEAVNGTEVAFLCIGTPGNAHGALQTDGLARVAREIGEALEGRDADFTVVVRSTVLPGTTRSAVLAAVRDAARPAVRSRLRVASNPEFIREGSALQDFAAPPFTLVGCETQDTADLLKRIYAGVDAPFVQTDLRTAEAVKYVSNAYHALKVCFANEIGDACAALGADAQEVMRIFRMDDKLNVSPAYLRPGFAFGGSCLPKDLKALLYAVHHADVSAPLLEAILPSNQAQIQQAVDTVMATGRKRIGICGLAFKPDTDDLRESPMVALVESLIGKGCDVRILDRNVSIAALMGANRRYIVEEIPHISSLMCERVETLTDHSDVLVFANDDADAGRVLQRSTPDQVIIDLTRGAIRARQASRRAA